MIQNQKEKKIYIYKNFQYFFSTKFKKIKIKKKIQIFFKIKKKYIFGISMKNCTIDINFIKIRLRVWKGDDEMQIFGLKIKFSKNRKK